MQNSIECAMLGMNENNVINEIALEFTRIRSSHSITIDNITNTCYSNDCFNSL